MVTIDDIRAAQVTLKNVASHTPMLPDNKLSKELDAKVSVKAECLQRSGSFKLRGAYNRISKLSEEERRRGVVTASAGNHAQGVALAASLNGIKSTIVLPEFAP
nr:pyridoxal-phosphate dependent enzyme [Blastocatellia bacterium]